MKQISLIMCTLLCSVFYSVAQVRQFEKGTGVLSIDIPFNIGSSKLINNTGKFTSTSFRFEPVISGGYFVTQNLMVGAGFGISKTFTRNKGEFYNSHSWGQTQLMPSLTLRYYRMFTPKFGMYGQFTAEGIIPHAPGSMYRTYGMNLKIAPRFIYLPTPNVGINFGVGELGYSFQKGVDPNSSINNSTTHGLLLQAPIQVGVSFFFRKKQ